MEMSNPRNELGLPKGNSGQTLTRARVRNMDGVTQRDALPLDGNDGGPRSGSSPIRRTNWRSTGRSPGATVVTDDEGMGRFAREDVRTVLACFGIAEASRAITTDSTEEVILLVKEDFDRVDVRALPLALMDVLPHTKVWVAEAHPRWSSEPL